MFLNIDAVDEKVIVAVSDDCKYFTYGELKFFCNKIRNIIKDRSLVFVLCENSIGSLYGYMSFLSNKIVPLLLDKHIDVCLLKNLIEMYNPRYLWIPNDLTKLFDYEPIFSEYGYTLVDTKLLQYDLYDNLALLLTTSGSTGSPKLVRQSYDNIKSNAEAIAEYLEITSNERPITTLPMNYTYGLSIINSHLLKGACILLTNKTLMEKEFWNFFKREKATSFGGVPYTYEILKKLRFLKMELPSLKTMTQAGGKLSPIMHKEFAEYAENNNRRFFVMYGQTEATARIAYLPYKKSIEKYGSMGIAIPKGKLTLIDIDGKEINEPEVVGELIYKGNNVTLGYAESGLDLIKGDENNGILITGDMAKRDRDGYYYIVGRKKRFIKIFGNRVNLDEAESLIKNKFAEIDCACTGVDDKMKIFINNTELSSRVKQFISEKTGLNSIAFSVKIIDAIPKNEAGKILYTRLEVEE